MSELETVNTRIDRVYLGWEDHGLFTAVIYTLGGSRGQAFGNRVMNDPVFALEFIKRTMDAVGVQEWGQLTGKFCRIQADSVHIHAIGHIIDDRWFVPDDLARELENTASNA